MTRGRREFHSHIDSQDLNQSTSVGNLPLYSGTSEDPHSLKGTCSETAHTVIHWCQIERCSFHLLMS